jgi:hypothetical protein
LNREFERRLTGLACTHGHAEIWKNGPYDGPGWRLFQPASIHQEYRAERTGLDRLERQDGREYGDGSHHGMCCAWCGCDGFSQRSGGRTRSDALNLYAFRHTLTGDDPGETGEQRGKEDQQLQMQIPGSNGHDIGAVAPFV